MLSAKWWPFYLCFFDLKWFLQTQFLHYYCIEILTEVFDSLTPGRCDWKFNPLRAKFFRENINIYLHFVSYLHIDTTQVVEILP